MPYLPDDYSILLQSSVRSFSSSPSAAYLLVPPLLYFPVFPPLPLLPQ